MENGSTELPIMAAHAAGEWGLPSIRYDLFDRILIAQACTEGVPLSTIDSQVLKCGSPTLLV